MSWRKIISTIMGRNRPARELSAEELRTILKTRFLCFRTLLKANNEVLEIMADMERILRSGESFGMTYVRANCTAICVNLFRIVQNLNAIVPDKYSELYAVSDRLCKEITAVMEQKRPITSKEYILPLRKVSSESADQAGNKMANLGEIKNRLDLMVPEGFVITAAAYEKYLEYNNLQEEINRRLQTVDINNLEMLHRTSSMIQQRIIQGTFPPELEREIMDAYGFMEREAHKGICLAMRSSAVGEDSSGVSFAGQYRSELNVSREFLLYAYKEIVASKYTLQAISYRLNRGFRDEDIPMCVGCMEMVDAVAGGVMYSRDPANVKRQEVLINSVWGLPKSVVEGTVLPDMFLVSRENAGWHVDRRVQSKHKQMLAGESEGTISVDVPEEDRMKPSLSKGQAVQLAEIAERLEDHFGVPQDVEWCIDRTGNIVLLQARPLTRGGEPDEVPLKAVDEAAFPNEILLRQGSTARGGAASGQAFVVNSALDMLQFPAGAILVTRYPLPQWASLLPRASAVVADMGSVTGHLATVAREFGIPAVFQTLEATVKIPAGEIITVDADRCRIYKGRVEQLLHGEGEKIKLMEGSPVYTLLETILQLITPLNLTNPDSLEFKPANCRTVHDITRFCHEMSVREIFDFSTVHSFRKYPLKRLVTHVPTQWWVLNLDDGFKEGVKGKTVRIEDITSVPMLAIWEGITAVEWKGPPPVDTRGFMSILFEATVDTELEPSMKSMYAEKNYLIISKNFCSLSSRFGFHFSTVEAYLSDLPRDNYISFNFRGGAADFVRKARRVEFIGNILRQFGFRTELHGDALFSRTEGQAREEIIKQLKIVGYIIMHTRQIDMVMYNQAIVNEYHDKFLKDIENFLKPDSRKDPLQRSTPGKAVN